MKIGFDVAQTCVEKAGCGYYADSLAKALVQNYPEHEFILYHHFGNWCNETTINGTTITASNVSTPLQTWSLADAKYFWSQDFIDPIKIGNPDIVVSNCFQSPKILNTPIMFTIYDISFWTHPEFHTEANRLVCQKGVLDAITQAKAFSFISNYSKYDFERVFPGLLTSRECLSSVTPLAPRGKRRERKFNKDQKNEYWLFVGSLEPRKNIDTLLDAYEIYSSKVPKPKQLKIAGGQGWNSSRTKARIDKLSKSIPVSHLGYVSDADLEILYTDAFSLIFPSFYEGFGLPVVEAMNQGTPVITTLNSSLEEIAKGHCLTFDPTDSNTLSNMMIKLENDPCLWSSLSQKSYKKADFYTWDKTAKLFMKSINKVVTNFTQS